ncbi:MAG: hypothetical protein HC940_11565 [Acaryochloris sp. SU_5_25]|nr:hypothetical protein [Acaryochloris sp. SU_5_25]
MIKKLLRVSLIAVSISLSVIGLNLPARADSDEAIQACIQTVPFRPSQNITGATLVEKVEESGFSYYLTSIQEVGNEWWVVVRMDEKARCEVVFMDPSGDDQGFANKDISRSVAVRLNKAAETYLRNKQ